MARYQARPVVVDAFKITEVGELVNGGLDGINLRLEDGTLAYADAGMVARYIPLVGDYFVVQADGHTYLNPKDVFERKYESAELNALELGAAVRKLGLAGG